MSTAKLTPGRYQGRDPATGDRMEHGITAIVSPKLVISYQARWSWTDAASRRQQKTKTFDVRDAAEEHLLGTKLKIRRGQYAQESTVTMGEYFEKWYARNLANGEWVSSTANRVRRDWNNHFRDHVGTVPVARMTTELCQEQVDRIINARDPANPKIPLYTKGTARVIISTLKGLINAARDEDIATGDPFAGVKGPKRKAPRKVVATASRNGAWSAAQATHFLNETKEHELSPLFWLMLTTGCRIGEALALRWSSVDLEEQAVTFCATLRTNENGSRGIGDGTKGSDEHITIPLIPVMADILKALKTEARKGTVVAIDGFVFPRADGRHRTYHQVYKVLRRLVTGLGLPWLATHGFRRTAGTLLAALKVPESVIMRVLRHSSLEVTSGYIVHQDETLRKALEVLARAYNTTTITRETGARVRSV